VMNDCELDGVLSSCFYLCSYGLMLCIAIVAGMAMTVSGHHNCVVISI
jgi:hypothetical protein